MSEHAHPLDPTLVDAYAYCARLAAEHYENFPVASRLLPVAMRQPVAAVYAFARTADDFADEPGPSTAERFRLLDGWLDRLHVAASGRMDRAVPGGAHGEVPAQEVHAQKVFLALGHTIETRRLPVGLFEDLISAFRQDITVTRYARWSDLLDYCRRSANPVGRLVLRIAGYDDPRLDESSDAFCTALQLTNFWQDLGVDWKKGRLYVPTDDRDAAGAREADLARGLMTQEWTDVLRTVAGRTQALFDRGRLVCDGVHGRLRYELRFTWLGGTRILERLEAVRYDALARRPALGASDAAILLWRALAWKAVR